jgi:hypothetical protein
MSSSKHIPGRTRQAESTSGMRFSRCWREITAVAPSSSDIRCHVPVRGTDEVAYLAIEQARLSAGQLCERAAPPQTACLQRADHELGMAGYYVSAQIGGPRRRELLIEANDRNRRTSSELTHATAAIMALVADAAYAVERLAIASDSSEHVALTAQHLACARVMLSQVFRTAAQAASVPRS